MTVTKAKDNSYAKLKQLLRQFATIPLFNNRENFIMQEAWIDAKGVSLNMRKKLTERTAAAEWKLQINKNLLLSKKATMDLIQRISSSENLMDQLIEQITLTCGEANSKQKEDEIFGYIRQSPDLNAIMNEMDTSLLDLFDRFKQFTDIQKSASLFDSLEQRFIESKSSSHLIDKFKQQISSHQYYVENVNTRLMLIASAFKECLENNSKFQAQMLRRETVERLLTECSVYRAHIEKKINKKSNAASKAPYEKTKNKLDEVINELKKANLNTVTAPQQIIDHLKTAKDMITGISLTAPNDSALKNLKNFILKAIKTLTFGLYKKNSEKFMHNTEKFFKTAKLGTKVATPQQNQPRKTSR